MLGQVSNEYFLLRLPSLESIKDYGILTLASLLPCLIASEHNVLPATKRF